jgi:hypothetical protein
MKKISVLSLLLIFLSSFAFAGTVNLPRTGQTKCYDAVGHVIPCAGTGQDGDIQAGVAWPEPRLTDNGNGTVTDNLTGLMWSKNANLPGGHKTWQEALDYCNNMTLAGHTDWRLLNRKELHSLIDFSQYNLALPYDYPFTNVQADNVQTTYYWSSTTYAISPGSAWIVDMWYGYMDDNGKSYNGYYVWPVRGGQTEPTGCSTWTDVISQYSTYVSGQASWTDVITCYNQYVTP